MESLQVAKQATPGQHGSPAQFPSDTLAFLASGSHKAWMTPSFQLATCWTSASALQ